LTTGIFPSDLKKAIVRPLLKKHNLDQNNLSNYRPVSNIPFMSKLLEKVFLSQLNAHLLSNGLYDSFQSAYRANRSTETSLLRIIHDLLLATDAEQISLLTLLDLSAAFDTIDHLLTPFFLLVFMKLSEFQIPSCLGLDRTFVVAPKLFL